MTFGDRMFRVNADWVATGTLLAGHYLHLVRKRYGKAIFHGLETVLVFLRKCTGMCQYEYEEELETDLNASGKEWASRRLFLLSV